MVVVVLNLEPKQKIAVLVMVILILLGGGYKFIQMQRVQLAPAKVLEQAGDDSGQVGAAVPASKPREVVVHVSGAVVRPGVYHLPEGSRVVDAVEAAGPSGDARLDLINLAAPLMDGQKVPVPGEQDIGMQAAVLPGSTVLTGVTGGFGMPATVNINTANQVQLETLPGIGPSLAGRIIQYRESNGPFRSTEDIKNVSGIGDKRYDQLKDLISVY